MAQNMKKLLYSISEEFSLLKAFVLYSQPDQHTNLHSPTIVSLKALSHQTLELNSTLVFNHYCMTLYRAISMCK